MNENELNVGQIGENAPAAAADTEASRSPDVGKPSFREKFIQKKSRPNRLHALDELRGLALVAMIVYHTLYDLTFMYGVPIPLTTSPWLIAFQRCICCTFILLSGFSARLSRNTARRGCIVFGAAMLLTLVTYLFLYEFVIWFGVLHLIGLSMILFSFLRKPLAHLNPWVGFGIFLALFLLTFELPSGYIGIPGVIRFVLPSSLYHSEYLFFLGFPHPSFWSSDYFPLLPWFFLFLAGTSLGRLGAEKKLPAFFSRLHVPPLAFLGRWSLVVYLLHQPVIYGLTWVCSNWLKLF